MMKQQSLLILLVVVVVVVSSCTTSTSASSTPLLQDFRNLKLQDRIVPTTTTSSTSNSEENARITALRRLSDALVLSPDNEQEGNTPVVQDQEVMDVKTTHDDEYSSTPPLILDLDRFLHTSSIHNNHRHLQPLLSTLTCTPNNNNADTQTCLWDQMPVDGFTTVFRNCARNADASILDCSTCTVVQQSNSTELDLEVDPICDSCTICQQQQTISYECNNIAEGECTVVDCDMQCVGPPPLPSESPSMAPSVAPLDFVCVRQRNGSLACFVTDTPREGFTLILVECPDTSNATLQDCGGCRVYDEASPTNIDPVNTPSCSACGICAEVDTVATDCTNLVGVDDECAITTCGRECLVGMDMPSAMPTMTSPPTASLAPTSVSSGMPSVMESGPSTSGGVSRSVWSLLTSAVWVVGLTMMMMMGGVLF